jgi:predicted ATPase
MITNLTLNNFKSWKNTGEVRLSPITGFFGSNSSGKTSLLQFLLALKQTVESTDRSQVFNFGDDHTPVDLGTFYDVIYRHDPANQLKFNFGWKLPSPLKISELETNFSEIAFQALIQQSQSNGQTGKLSALEFEYTTGDYQFGMQRNASKNEYKLHSDPYTVKRQPGRVWELPAPVRFYGFPDEVFAYYQNVSFLSEFALQLEKLFNRVYYLGPLREYPHRSYKWSGEVVRDVGQRGELAVPAMLASRESKDIIQRGRGRRNQTVEECVADWLKKMGLIHSFHLQSIAENRKDYELRVQKTPQSSEVLITDVGFGISQILPILVLCYYVPKNSILIFEQPEIHLHPAVQYMLADVFIDAVKNRNVQIILESHSEHLLLRLQRRIAEGQFEAENAALYFTEYGEDQSHLTPLKLDLFGNITNWPKDFFGDQMGEVAARTMAGLDRKSKGE